MITESKLEQKNASTLYEALEGTPGIRVEQQCQYCNFSMIRMQGLGSEHTQVLINGQPMYSGLAGVYGLQQISTIDIGQIEVVKGSGSAIYGSSAVAGAINIVSKEPDYEPRTAIDLQFASFNSNRFSINTSMLEGKGNIGINVFASYLNEGEIDETGAGNNIDEVNRKDGISDRVYSNLVNGGFNLFFYNSFFNDEKMIIRGKVLNENREGGTLIDDYFKNPLTDGTENIVTKRYESQISYTKLVGTESEINLLAGLTKHNRTASNDTFLNDYFDTHNGDYPDLRKMRPYIANETSINSTLSFSTLFGQHKLLVGVQLFKTKLQESGMYIIVDEKSDHYGEPYKSTANKEAFEFGGFLQDEFQVFESLIIVAGVRFDSHFSQEEYKADKQIFDSNFPIAEFDKVSINPRLSVKWDLIKDFSIRANFGTGFRTPFGFSEELHLCSGSPRVWKTSSLKPEESMSLNLSADYYGNNFVISANLFRTNLINKIAFVEASEQTRSIGYDYEWTNIDDAFVQGIEFSAQYSFFNDLNVALDITYNQGEYKNFREDWVGTEYENISKIISRFPDFTAGFIVEYNPRNWIINISGSFQGNMYIDYYNVDINPELGDKSKIYKTNPYWLINTKVSHKISQFKIYCGANNLLSYIQPIRFLDDPAFMFAPVYGRLLFAGVAIDLMH